MNERDWQRLERDQRILGRLRQGDAYKAIAFDEGLSTMRISQLACENGFRQRERLSSIGPSGQSIEWRRRPPRSRPAPRKERR